MKLEAVIMRIRAMNELRRVDLNLLVVLGALLDEQHVSRAASALGMSQPAVSHALARLRDQLGDPLLVRAGRGLTTTAFSDRLRPQVHDLLRSVRHLLLPVEFDPATACETVALAMSDYAAALFMPGLLSRVRAEAPGVTLHMTQTSREGMAAELTAGRLDMALGVFPFPIAEVNRATLIEEHFVCIGDRERWAGATQFSIEDYLAAAHLQVSVGPPRAEVDRALAENGATRRIAAMVPHFTLAPDFIVGTDLLLTIASRMVREDDPRFTRLPLPVAVPSFPYVLTWHKRTEETPLHAWLRSLLIAASSSL